MLPGLFKRVDDVRRLRWLLALLFLALLIPTAAVLWQAYGQLQWESFHQHRGQAESLTRQINADITRQLSVAENQSFAAYSFLNVTGDPEAGFVQRSPLSEFPVTPPFPGVIGYFQIESDGTFSTPLLPGDQGEASSLGISGDELLERQRLATRIRTTLSGNNLIVDQPGPTGVEAQAFLDELKEAGDRRKQDADLGRQLNAAPEDAFDRETVLSDEVAQTEEARAFEPVATAPGARENRTDQYAKVQDLQLDDALQKKSESAEEESDRLEAGEALKSSLGNTPSRARRTEQSVLPASAPPVEASADAAGPGNEVRITTFESEVDPFEFALLDSGEFVLFRKVWRNNERLVQGMLIDQTDFVTGLITEPFRSSAISATTGLVLAFGDYVLSSVGAAYENDYFSAPTDMQGDLLFRSRLTSPLDSMELIYSVGSLPAGPGATVLGWTSVLLLVVFGAGFLALYRLGLGQIQLARKQQDFVSSVSHELKTPLTSIRMYSEMLKEGWADDDRRQQYYAFIHDESERLSRLISNVLQLASITRNQPSFDLRPYRVRRLMDQVSSKIASQVEHAGFHLVIDCPEEIADWQVEVDEDCLMQIVINLVDNAIKFSRDAEQRQIEISAASAGSGGVQFRIRDFGPGIPKEQMKKIFRLFYRPESELTRETVGTGIGLAIVHQLTKAMVGKVDVVNRDPGAEFQVTFPVTRG